ncbi:MAG: multiheme c-type cytochrome [Bradymonadaceae bacterium]
MIFFNRYNLTLIWIVSCLLCLGACDRDKKAPAEEHGEESAQAEVSSAIESLHDEVEPGSVEPEDLGPKAPAVFFLTGLNGYTEPCGCTADVLLGGIDRITGYIEAARNLHPAVALVDGGDIFFGEKHLDEHMHAQERAKANLLAAAHREMGTVMTVPGELDFALGTDFYLEKLEEAGIEPIAGNLKIGDRTLKGSHTATIGNLTVGFIGVVQPDLYDDIEGIEVSDEEPSILIEIETLRGKVDAVVLVYHGELGRAKAIVEQYDGAIDFVIIGHGPRETDQVDKVGDGHTLEAYDQGRYLGVLKLYPQGERRYRKYTNALAGSKAEAETLERQIDHVRQSLERIAPVEDEAEVPPMVVTLRERLANLEERKAAIEQAELELPENESAFIYRPVAMIPGFPLHEGIHEKRLAFNRSLQELNADIDREPIPVVDGEPFFVGTQECALCHGAARDFWETTAHSKAVATLEARDKAFDQNCIGCHVVGWEKPGGSVLGKLRYEAELGEHTITKDLRNVGCESCHGPGSAHRLAPLDASGSPQHIIARPEADQCTQCHVQEHSPRFDFETYVHRVTGEGHKYSGGP